MSQMCLISSIGIFKLGLAKWLGLVLKLGFFGENHPILGVIQSCVCLQVRDIRL